MNRGFYRGMGQGEPFPVAPGGQFAGVDGMTMVKDHTANGGFRWGGLPTYHAQGYGVFANGQDQTVVMNQLCAYVITNGGGTIVLPLGTTLLNNPQYPFNPYPFGLKRTYLRITGQGQVSAYTDAAAGASILDLRFNNPSTGSVNPNLIVTATGGTYTLWFFGSQTASINFNDNAATIQTRLRALPAGGSLVVSGGGTVTNPFVISGPNSNLTLSVQTNSLTGGSATVTNNPMAKMDIRGQGELELDHFSIVSGGTDDYLFCQITNTAVYAHDLYIRGHSANSGTACVQDAFNFGSSPGSSVDSSSITTGASDAAFQGYGTVMERIAFTRIRTGFRGFSAANAIDFNNNVFDQTCGGDATHGAFTFGASILPCTGNVFNGNLIESGNYPYPFVLTSGANNNKGFGNQVWDATATTLATVSDAGTGNRFYGTYTSVANDFPDVNSLITITAGTQQSVTGFTVNSVTSVTINIAATAGFNVGAQVVLAGVGGTNINGTWRITAVVANTSITVATTNASGTTSSGGTATPTFTPTATGTYRVTCVGSGGSGASGGTPNSSLNNQAGGGAGSQGGASTALIPLVSGTAYPISIGAAAAAPATTTAGGNPGANGNNGNPTTFQGPSFTVTGAAGHGGNGGAASSTATASGANSSLAAIVQSNPVSDGCGGSGNFYAGLSSAGGGSIGYGAGGGGGGGSASTTNGGSAGAPGAFGNAAAGTNGGSGTANGANAAAAAATSYGAGGGGGGAGATNAGTGGRGGASGPGVIQIEGPVSD